MNKNIVLLLAHFGEYDFLQSRGKFAERIDIALMCELYM